MSWIQMLAETYDNCRGSIGYDPQPGRRPLLPLCHITAQAQIEIVLDGAGNFRRASVVEKEKSTTIVPSTESSASRAGSKPESHPLCDKLQYVAGDYEEYGGVVTSGFAKEPGEPFNSYLQHLAKWATSEHSHPKVRAVLAYVQQQRVIRDLVEQRILWVGDDGSFLSKEEMKRENNAKDIFSVVNAQEDAFVRWVIEGETGESRVWRDESLWESWTKFYLSDRGEKSLCYVTGEEQLLTTNHPKYIRREGDGAKLISANDTSGFTFRGRLVTDQQVTGVGLEASHKSHYALIWLISRQGYRKGDLAVVAWAKSGAPVPQPTEDTLTLLFGEGEEEEPDDTAQDLAIQLKKRIAGYGKAMRKNDSVAVMAVDSATPGRLAITYYRALAAWDLLQRIDQWHKTCAWLHRYRSVETQDKESGKTIRKVVPFTGAPAPNDIAEAAYGTTLDDKLRKATIERILPCIIDGQPIPRDLVESTVRRAANRAGLEDWEWNKALSIACALFKKYATKENYTMTLDPARTTRDYLYGRLLALADSLEEWALREAGEARQTNAARLMQRFAERPYSTWRNIELALTPYKARLGGKSRKRQQMIDEVVASFSPEDFTNDKPLSGEFLLGYHSQRAALRASHSDEKPGAESGGEAVGDSTDESDEV